MSNQSHTPKDISQLSDAELDAALKEAAEKRKATTKAFETAATRKRKENELRLAQIEAETGKTVGVDLGVVWTEHGDMIVVQHPPMLVFEKCAFRNLQSAGAGLAMDSTVVEDLLAEPTIVYPKESGLREEIYRKTHGAARISAALLVQKMCDQTQVVFEGKS
jgi:hypothetical protein